MRREERGERRVNEPSYEERGERRVKEPSYEERGERRVKEHSFRAEDFLKCVLNHLTLLARGLLREPRPVRLLKFTLALGLVHLRVWH